MMTKKSFLSLALLALGLVAAQAQTNWSTEYFSSDAGYTRNSSPTDQPSNGPTWQTTDPYEGETNFIMFGDSGNIGFVAGYTAGGGSSLTNLNNSMWFGGYAPSQFLPNTTNPTYYYEFTNFAPEGTLFKSRFAIVNPGGNVYTTNNDTFYFDLRSSNNAGSIVKIAFNPWAPIINSNTPLGIDWYRNGTNQDPDNGTSIAYNSIYELGINLRSGNVFDAYIVGINGASNTLVPGTYTNLYINEPLSDGFSVGDFASVSIGWDLTSGDNTQPAGNYILVNDVSVVPEPSTLGMLALGACGLGALYLRRRR